MTSARSGTFSGIGPRFFTNRARNFRRHPRQSFIVFPPNASSDFVARIPMGRAAAGSLNASVAAGVVLYEVFRQRENARPADGGSAAPS